MNRESSGRKMLTIIRSGAPLRWVAQHAMSVLTILLIMAAVTVVIACAGTDNPPTLAVGERCTDTAQCADSLVCAGKDGNKVCSDKSAGSTCASQSECINTLYCDLFEEDGDPISNLCDGRLARNISCKITDQCLIDLACAGEGVGKLCSDKRILSVCANESECVSGLICAGLPGGKLCSNKLVGSVCATNEQCVSGLVCGTVCTTAVLGTAVKIGGLGAITAPTSLAAHNGQLYLAGSTGMSATAGTPATPSTPAVPPTDSTIETNLFTVSRSTGVASRVHTSSDFHFNSVDATKGLFVGFPSGLASLNDVLYVSIGIFGALYVADTTNGTLTRVGTGALGGGNGLAAFDSKLYGASGTALYTVNVTTGTGTKVADFIPSGLNIAGIAAVGSTLYGVSATEDALYSIHPTTAAATKINGAALLTPGFGFGELAPTGLAAVGDVLYMIGNDTDALYSLRYQ